MSPLQAADGAPPPPRETIQSLIRPDSANRIVANPMSSGTTAVNAFSGVARRSAAPVALPTTAISARLANVRSQRGIRSRSASPATRLPGVSATVLVALATIGGRPAASRAGKVISEAPPTIAVTMPPASPAPNSGRSPQWPSTIARLRCPGASSKGDQPDAARAHHEPADFWSARAIVELDRAGAARLELDLQVAVASAAGLDRRAIGPRAPERIVRGPRRHPAVGSAGQGDRPKAWSDGAWERHRVTAHIDQERPRRLAFDEFAALLDEGKARRVFVDRDHDADAERVRVARERFGIERVQWPAEERDAVELFDQPSDRARPRVASVRQRRDRRGMRERAVHDRPAQEHGSQGRDVRVGSIPLPAGAVD